MIESPREQTQAGVDLPPMYNSLNHSNTIPESRDVPIELAATVVTSNTMRSPAAFAVLAHQCADLGVAAVLIQEPPRRLPATVEGFKSILPQFTPEGSADEDRRPRVCILLRTSMPHKLASESRDTLALDTKLPGHHQWVRLASIYLSSNIGPTETLRDVELVHPSIVAGDLNCSHSTWGSPTNPTSTRTEQVLEWTVANDLACINGNRGRPTFRGSIGRTYIDAVFVSQGLVSRCSAATVPDFSETIPTDHECLMWTVAPTHTSPQQNTRRRAKDTNWKKFHELIRQLRSKGPVLSPQDLQSRTSRLINTLRNAVKYSTRVSRVDGSRRQTKDWWGHGKVSGPLNIDRARKNYQRARGHANRDPGDSGRRLTECRAHKEYVKAIFNAKKRYWQHTVETLDPSGVTRIMMGRQSSGHTQAIDADSAADYFFGTARTLEESRPPQPPPLGAQTPSRSGNVSLTAGQVEDIIRGLPSGKSPGDDFTSYEHWREAAQHPELLEELRLVLEAIINFKTFPEALKPTKVVLIGKPNKRVAAGADVNTRMKAIRPISLLRTLSKIAEKAILQQLECKIQALPRCAQGFRKGFSTTTALKEVDDFLHTVGRGGEVAGVLLEDFTGAFDNIPWEAILDGVKEYLGPDWVDLIVSYLQGRRVTVAADDGSTSTRYLQKGTPQGGCLSPLLFLLASLLLYTKLERRRELTEDEERWSIKIIGYADDFAIAVKAEDIQTLGQALSDCRITASTWAETRRIPLAEEKEELLLFAKRPQCEEFAATYGHLAAKGKPEAKWLGVWLRPTPTGIQWDKHAHSVIESARGWARQIRSFCRWNSGLNPGTAQSLWHGYLLPRATYAASVWGTASTAKWFSRASRGVMATLLRSVWRATPSAPTAIVSRLANWRGIAEAIARLMIKDYCYKQKFVPRRLEKKALKRWLGDSFTPDHFESSESSPAAMDIELDTSGIVQSGVGTHQWYTDGSKLTVRGTGLFHLATRTGFGVVRYDPGGKPETYEARALPRETTVYQSEVCAIGRACELEMSRLSLSEGLEDEGDVEILSDCLSALSNISRATAIQPTTVARSRALALALHERLRRRNRRLVMRWVRAHRGNVPNALADTTARLGATMGNHHPCPIPQTAAMERLKTRFEASALIEWQRQKGHLKGYHESRANLGKQQRETLSKVANGGDRRRLLTVISGHGDVMSHLKHTKPALIQKIGLKCRHCNVDEETISHLVFHCRCFKPHREWMRLKIGGAFPQRISVFLEDARKTRLLLWLLRKIWPDGCRELGRPAAN